MSWPPTPAAASKYINSSAVVEWGTDNLMVAATILKSIKSMDVIETIYIENGTGLRAIRVQLWQGREVELTVVARSDMNYPAPGATVTVIDPLDRGTNYAFKVIDNNYNANRKQEGERGIKAECMWIIDNAGNVGGGTNAVAPNAAFPGAVSNVY